MTGEEATEAFVALGSNQGDRASYLRSAVRGLDAHGQICVTEVSPVYETEAHTLAPDEEQPPYLNAVVALRTTLSPEALLALCQDIERKAGRERGQAWQPRTLDLDLLVYGTETRHSPQLTLPHPRLGERRFVLRPLADLRPNLYVPPPFDATAAELLAQCPDTAALARTDLAL